MATLFNTKIKDTYQSLLKLEDNTILTTTSKNITDGLGNASPLYLSTTQVRIGSNSASAMYWDNTNNRLGIGTSSPTQSIETPNAIVFASANNDSKTTLKAFDASTGNIDFTNEFIISRQGTNLIKMFFNNRIGIGGAGSSAKLSIKGEGSTSATTSLLVQNSVGNNVFSIKDDENILIGSGTNGGYKLDVNGTSNIRGSLRMGEPTVAGLVRSHPSVAMNFGGGAGDNVFTFTQINQGAFQSSSANQSLIRASINQGELGTTNYGSVFLSVGTLSNSGGTPIYNSFESRQTINCSGGTTIYRGFYHNPTLTLTTGVTHRAIETVTGDVLFGTTSGKATFGSGVAGTSYIEIKPGISNGFNRITFNDFDGGTATRGGFIEISTYLAQINFGSYNSFYLGNSSKPYNFYMVAGTSNIIISTGNIVPTDSGALFQVKGTGSTSATSSLLVQNSGGSELLKVTDDGVVTGAALTSTGTLRAANNKLEIYNPSGNEVRLRNPAVGNYFYIGPSNICGSDAPFVCPSIFLNSGFIYGSNTGVVTNTQAYAMPTQLNPIGSANSCLINLSGGGRLQGSADGQYIRVEGTIQLDGASNELKGFFFNPTLTGAFSNQNVLAIHSTYGGGYFNTATPQASAVLQADSTTQGMLPPRMTDAQIRAIASPVNGLVAYNTTIDHLCCYHGGAWVKFNHSPM